MRRYAVVFEKASHNWAAFVPDLPGCISTGSTRAEVGENIKEAIEFHIEGLLEDGQPVPEPSSEVDLVEMA